MAVVPETWKGRFRPLEFLEGYLPIADHGLIGDGTTAALVGRDGAIVWLCVPRFDAAPLFCRILDANRGGSFRIAPAGLVESRQYYLPDTPILVTEMRSPTGIVQVQDALTLQESSDLHSGDRAGKGELLRSVRVLEGSVDLQVELEPREGAEVTREEDNLRIRCHRSELGTLRLGGSVSIKRLPATFELRQGQELLLSLQWNNRDQPLDISSSALQHTASIWKRWVENITYRGPHEPVVRRSAITLKLLDYLESGAIVAAPTSSLPEEIGGVRNWDYRYAWVRDAAFSVYALRRIGLTREATAFLIWVLNDVETTDRPHVLYDLDGKRAVPERSDHALEGYRKSRPVRWGNDATEQYQHDVYGEMLDCAYQWWTGGGEICQELWPKMAAIAKAAEQQWHQPDHGIWEVRAPRRVFTYSAALCQVALDRGARIAAGLEFAEESRHWHEEAQRVRDAILQEAWNPDRKALTEHLGGGGLDASLLSLPLRRVIAADHPKMIATTAAIAEHLSAGDGLLYRYLPDESPDGLPGREGAFLLCSFWLVDNYAQQGRLDEAYELYESLCSRAGILGLLPEQIDPASSGFLGNYPQAISHVGLISSGVNLQRIEDQHHQRQ